MMSKVVMKHYTSSDITSITPFEIREFLYSWVEKHRAFAEKISSHVLECKSLHLDDYISFICDLHSPIDEIALVILVRMFHFHIGIVMSGKYWTTK